jgi:hypothetical protein
MAPRVGWLAHLKCKSGVRLRDPHLLGVQRLLAALLALEDAYFDQI